MRFVPMEVSNFELDRGFAQLFIVEVQITVLLIVGISPFFWCFFLSAEITLDASCCTLPRTLEMGNYM
jgi:hypothetical protein